MNKFFRSVAVLTTVAVFAAGCSVGGGSDKNPEDVVKEGLASFYDVTSYSYNISFVGDANVEGDMVAFDLGLTGSQDMADPKDPKLTLKLLGSGTLNEGAGQKVDAEMRLTKENIYLMITELTDFDGLAPTEVSAPFVGKWWSMALPPGTFDDVPAVGDDANLTPEQIATKELMKETVFFTDLKDLGMDQGSYHYSGVLDEDVIVEFTKKAAEINDQTVSEGELADLRDGLDKIDLGVEIWVDEGTMTLSGLAGALKMMDGADAINVDFEAHFDNINEAITVEIPEGSEIFDPLMLLGGF